MKKTINMTEGSIKKNVLLFSLPLIASNLLQVFFNLADIAVAGKFSGPVALGCVGSTSILIAMFIGIIMGMSNGVNIITARHLGAGDSDKTKACVHTSFVIMLATGLILSIIGLTGADFILGLLNTKSDLITGAALYFRIFMIGIPALAIYNFGNAVYSAEGETRKPLIFLSIAGVINVILNLYFVIELNMGVAGVGFASVISQYITAVLVMISLMRSNADIAFSFKNICFDRNEAALMMPLSLSSACQNSIFQIANLFIQTAVNSFDTVTVEGISAATNADALVYDVMNAFYIACVSFMGQNYGAGKKKRVLESYFVCLAYSFLIGLILGILLFVFGREFLSVFTNDKDVIEAGLTRLSIMGISYGFSAFMDNTICANRSLGYSVGPTIIVICGSCIFRVIWVLTVFAAFHTVKSLYLLYIFSWAITSIAEIIFFVCVWRKTS